jgi:hypothetical protein
MRPSNRRVASKGRRLDAGPFDSALRTADRVLVAQAQEC